VIHGVSESSEARHGLLMTEEQFGDFAVRVRYRAHEGNSGLYFRIEEGSAAGVLGFQAEIDPQRKAGGLYETGGRAWVVEQKDEDVARWYRPGEWNGMTVVALGRGIVVHVSGFLSAELRDDPGRTRGHIALQLHGGQDMDIELESLEILDLSGRALGG
jgi:hypothetical protein